MGWFDLIIVQPIFNLLLGIYSVTRDFGLAIIIFTIIVKILMWPLVKRQLHQAKLMRKVQPELAKIRKNCKGNKQLESMQMMDLYKRNNVKPFASILTLLVQLPIFIALFRVINMIMDGSEVIDRFAYGFMQNIPIIDQLINQYAQFSPNLWFIDLTQRALSSPVTVSSAIILVFVFAAVTLQYIVTRQQLPTDKPKKRFRDIMKQSADGKEIDQSEVNNAVSGTMSKVLPVMMFVFLINFYGALALYFLVSNIMTYFQQTHIFKKDEDEVEVLPDKKPKSSPKGKDKKNTKKVKEAKVVKTKTKKGKTNITRITASDKKGRKKK